MATPQALTQVDINTLQSYIDAGTVSGAIDYYTYLSNKGYDYATLALGMVQDNTPSGSTARDYAEKVGKITGTNINVTSFNTAIN